MISTCINQHTWVCCQTLLLFLFVIQPRNLVHRAAVQKATKEGVTVHALSHPLFLTQDFIDTALTLSDVLDLNELSAVELLLAGEQSQPDFPGLARGLVAVLLYYDGRRSLATSLRSLIQAREGVSWTLGLNNMVVAVVHAFTDYLFQGGLVDKILSLVDETDIKQELDKLSKAKGIKDARHGQQISDLIEDQRNALADCLFYWACQNPFPKEEILKILARLKKVPAQLEIQPLDYTTLSLFLTLLTCFNIGDAAMDAPSLDSSFVDSHYPIISDCGLLSAIHQELKKNDWSYPALGAAVNFAWGVLLRECSPLDAFRGWSYKCSFTKFTVDQHTFSGKTFLPVKFLSRFIFVAVATRRRIVYSRSKFYILYQN